METFGHWTVISTEGTGGWLCRCVCGTEKRIRASKLRAGRSGSCGCRGFVAGARFGHWTVLAPIDPDNKDKALCGCVCGTERGVFRNVLMAGKSTSCGCTRNEATRDRMSGRKWPEGLVPVRRDPEIKPGARFGRWTALTLPYTDPESSYRIAQCRCECGEEKAVMAHKLLSGQSKSCGCLKRDGARARLSNR